MTEENNVKVLLKLLISLITQPCEEAFSQNIICDHFRLVSSLVYANIKLYRLGSFSILSVVAARRTGHMLQRSGIYGRLH